MNSEDDATALSEILSALGELHNQEVTERVRLIWWDVLEDQTIEEVGAAFKVFLRSERGNFMPKPSEVLLLCRAERRRSTELKRIEGPAATFDQQALKKIEALVRDALSQDNKNPRAWLTRLRQRERAGEYLYPFQRDALRELAHRMPTEDQERK